MAATDKELQKLGKPPIYSGKGGRVERVELRDEKLHVSTVGTRSSATGRCRRRDEPRYEHGENQDHPH